MIMAITSAIDPVARTIDVLQAAGERKEERVVLWLGPASARPGATSVTEMYEPDQITDIDYFRLPPATLQALMRHLRAGRLKIVAQVHSHPGEAFHSEVDDEWAIVRHVGALSLVVPDFARWTTPTNFVDQAVAYELSANNEWLHTDTIGALRRIRVLP